MTLIAKRTGLVLAVVIAVGCLGIVVSARASASTPSWVSATQTWAASGVKPGDGGPITTLKRVVARALSSSAQQQAATVKTDKTSYLPGSPVVVTGTGFIPGELIQLSFAEIQVPGGFVDAPVVYSPVTDATGAFVDQSYTTDNHHANIPIKVTAKGLASGITAETTFSNGAVIWTDDSKYHLTQTIYINGAGFTPGASVTVTVLRPDHVTDTISPLPYVANDGTFQTSYAPLGLSGRYKITATDGANNALTAVTEADATSLDNVTYDKASGNWGTTTQSGYSEGDWVPYQYTVVLDKNKALPSFNVVFNHLANTNHIAIDAFANFRLCINCSYPTGLSALAAGTPEPPPGVTTGIAVAQAGGGSGSWYDFTPTIINAPYNSGTGACSGSDATNTPSAQHCFLIDPTAINATQSWFPVSSPQAGGPFANNQYRYTIYFEAHLASTSVWSAGTEASPGYTAPANAFPLTVRGTSAYTGWTTNAYSGAGGAGSALTFQLLNPSPAGIGPAAMPIPAPGIIVLTKNTTNGNGAFAFTTTGGGGLSNTTLTTAGGTKSQTFTNIDPTKTYSIAETSQVGWLLTSSSCSSGSPAGFATGGSTVTCTFVNSQPATIVIVKNTTGGDGSFSFTTTGGITNPASIATSGGSGATTITNVDPTRTYTIVENVPAGWVQAGTPSCTGQASGTVDGGFVPTSGATTTCTFANAKNGSIVLVKNTLGGNGSFAFTTTGGGGFSNTTLTTVGGTKAQTYTNVDTTRTFSVSESAQAGWSLTNSTCSTGTPASFTVPAGGTTTCTFTNGKNPQLTLAKHVTNVFGGASSTDFTMTASGPTPISGAGGVASGPGFLAGMYTLGETSIAGYQSGIWNCVGSGVFSYGNPSAYNTSVLSLSPTAFWRFNELGGPTFADATGNGHTLTMPDIEFGVPGAIGGTTTGVNVSNGKFQMADISVPVGTASFEWWLKPLVQGGDTYGALVQDNNNFGNGFYLRDDGSGKVNATAFFFADQLNTTAMKTDGTLYHLVATVDGTGNGQWYLNGVADGTFTYGGLNVDRAFQNDANETLQATLMDEMAIYPGTLSGAAVATHYTQGIANAPATYQATVMAATPTAYWKFEETSGSTLSDASGNGHTLTMPSITFGVVGDTIGSTGLSMTNGVAGMTPISLLAGPVSFSWVLKPLVQGGDGYGTLLEDSQNFGNGFYLHDNGSGKVWLDAFDYIHNDQHNNTPLNTDGTLYHIVASVDGSGHGTWYVNGVADGTFTYFSGGYNMDRAFQNEAYEALQVSLIDRMAIFPVAVSGAQAMAQFNLATATTTVTLGPGDVVSCDITNTDQLAHLKLVKSVTNDNGGTAVATDFYLAAKGPTPIFGKGTAEQNVNAGTYTLLESKLPGYTGGTWNCVGGSQNGTQVTLTQGQSATCTIINNDNPPSLTLVKQVSNTHGGTAVAANWTLSATGPTSISGAGGVASDATFDAGSYALSESGGPSGYTAGVWNCIGGSMSDATHVTVGLGQTATCTITNSDTSAQLTLTKVVLGGAKTTADFTLTATGPTTISGVSGSGTVTSAAVNAGTYTLSETTDPNYTASTWSCTNGVAVTAGHITLAAGQVTTCTITNTTTLGVSVNSTTSCSAFSTGALSGLFVDSLSYALANNGNVANSISPNTFAYYSRVTITAGQTITITQGNDQAAVPLFTTTKNLVTVYDTSCNTVTKTVDVTNLAAVAITGVPAGTYIVQVRFDSQPVVGTAPPSPTSVHYSFATKAGATVVDHNGNGVDLIKR